MDAFAKQRNIHSRSRDKWEEQEHLVKLAPNGWNEKKELKAAYEEINVENTESPAMAKKQPLRNTEDIIVFNSGVYHPQGLTECTKKLGGNKRGSKGLSTAQKKEDYKQEKTNYPRCLLEISADNYGKNCFHPTQKPVALMEYLIKTYTNEGETVLDFAMGSGTTGVACVNLGRKFIGIEKDLDYFNIALTRIENTQAESEG